MLERSAALAAERPYQRRDLSQPSVSATWPKKGRPGLEGGRRHFEYYNPPRSNQNARDHYLRNNPYPDHDHHDYHDYHGEYDRSRVRRGNFSRDRYTPSYRGDASYERSRTSGIACHDEPIPVLPSHHHTADVSRSRRDSSPDFPPAPYWRRSSYRPPPHEFNHAHSQTSSSLFRSRHLPQKGGVRERSSYCHTREYSLPRTHRHPSPHHSDRSSTYKDNTLQPRSRLPKPDCSNVHATSVASPKPSPAIFGRHSFSQADSTSAQKNLNQACEAAITHPDSADAEGKSFSVSFNAKLPTEVATPHHQATLDTTRVHDEPPIHSKVPNPSFSSDSHIHTLSNITVTPGKPKTVSNKSGHSTRSTCSTKSLYKGTRSSKPSPHRSSMGQGMPNSSQRAKPKRISTGFWLEDDDEEDQLDSSSSGPVKDDSSSYALSDTESNTYTGLEDSRPPGVNEPYPTKPGDREPQLPPSNRRSSSLADDEDVPLGLAILQLNETRESSAPAVPPTMPSTPQVPSTPRAPSMLKAPIISSAGRTSVEQTLARKEDGAPAGDTRAIPISEPPQNLRLLTSLPDLTHSPEVRSQYRDVQENQYPLNCGGDRYAALRGLGGKKKIEVTECYCSYDPKDPQSACGVWCINRQTAIECDHTCPSGSHCLNRRLQRREWIKSSVVETGRKGFGLRADESVDEDQLIIEYVGEIIGSHEQSRRKDAYSREGLRHFYFMSLGREQYVDATKVACKARFLNHSCRPNCHVVKWHVGTAVRMGVFALRHIEANEELTFDYNSEVHGKDQTCFCGESNCRATLGRRSVTNVDNMDDHLRIALGLQEQIHVKPYQQGQEGRERERVGGKPDEAEEFSSESDEGRDSTEAAALVAAERAAEAAAAEAERKRARLAEAKKNRERRRFAAQKARSEKKAAKNAENQARFAEEMARHEQAAAEAEALARESQAKSEEAARAAYETVRAVKTRGRQRRVRAGTTRVRRGGKDASSHCLEEEDIPKLIVAMRQANDNQSILLLLVERLGMCSSPALLRHFIRLHGLQVLAQILFVWLDNQRIVESVLSILMNLPVSSRNRLDDAGLPALLHKVSTSYAKHRDIRTNASSLRRKWEALPVTYRIGRNPNSVQADASSDAVAAKSLTAQNKRSENGITFFDHLRYDVTQNEDPTAVAPLFREDKEEGPPVPPSARTGDWKAPRESAPPISEEVSSDPAREEMDWQRHELEWREDLARNWVSSSSALSVPTVSDIINRALRRRNGGSSFPTPGSDSAGFAWVPGAPGEGGTNPFGTNPFWETGGSGVGAGGTSPSWGSGDPHAVLGASSQAYDPIAGAVSVLGNAGPVLASAGTSSYGAGPAWTGVQNPMVHELYPSPTPAQGMTESMMPVASTSLSPEQGAAHPHAKPLGAKIISVLSHINQTFNASPPLLEQSMGGFSGSSASSNSSGPQGGGPRDSPSGGQTQTRSSLRKHSQFRPKEHKPDPTYASGTPAQRQARAESRLKTLVSEYVVYRLGKELSMLESQDPAGRIKKDLSQDEFKKHAKAFTETLTIKTIKKQAQWPAPELPCTLETDTYVMIKHFVSMWTKANIMSKRPAGSPDTDSSSAVADKSTEAAACAGHGQSPPSTSNPGDTSREPPHRSTQKRRPGARPDEMPERSKRPRRSGSPVCGAAGSGPCRGPDPTSGATSGPTSGPSPGTVDGLLPPPPLLAVAAEVAPEGAPKMAPQADEAESRSARATRAIHTGPQVPLPPSPPLSTRHAERNPSVEPRNFPPAPARRSASPSASSSRDQEARSQTPAAHVTPDPSLVPGLPTSTSAMPKRAHLTRPKRPATEVEQDRERYRGRLL